MRTTRQAVMNVSRELMEHMLPPGKVIECVADKLGVQYEWLVEAMQLPAGSRITGVSIAVRFFHDEVAIRIEHPDFIETAEARTLPEVQAIYERNADGSPRFVKWCGAAVGEG